jgi:hypothetical protein
MLAWIPLECNAPKAKQREVDLMAQATTKVRRAAVLLSAGALSVGLLSACSSSGGSSGGSKSPTPAAFNETTASQQVKSNWATFFNSKTPNATRLTYLQNGTQLTAVLAAEAASPLSKGTTARVTKVVFAADHNTANITYDILSNGSPSLQNSLGVAVFEGGVWKVSKATFCGLAGSFASATGATLPPGCGS